MTVFNNINANVGALSAKRHMDINTGKQARANAQLASGSLTSDPSENPAGSSLGSLLATNIAAEVQASANVTQAAAMLQLAAGTQEYVIEILTTMKARATQANSDTISDAARAMLDEEFQDLLTQIDSAAKTKWNDVLLFAGGNGEALRRSALDAEGLTDVAVATTDISNEFTFDGFLAGSVDDNIVVTTEGSDSSRIEIKIGGQAFRGTLKYGVSGALRLESTIDSSSAITLDITGTGLTSASTIKAQLETLFKIDTSTPVSLRSASTDLSPNAIVSITAGTATLEGEYGLSYGYDERTEKITYKLTNGKTEWTETFDSKTSWQTGENVAARTIVFKNGMTVVTASNMNERQNAPGYELIDVNGGTSTTMRVQIGSSTETMMVIDFQSLNTSVLGFANANLQTKEAAVATSHIVEAAIIQVNSMKADLGGKKSQLNFQGQALELQRQNETAAKATFTDADIAVSLQDSMQFQALAQMAQNVFANLLQEASKLGTLVQQALQ